MSITEIQNVLEQDKSQLLARDRLDFSLRHATVRLNSECNLACSYCYASAEKPRKGNTMTIDTALRIVDSLSLAKQRHGFGLDICWSGGEVLLNVNELKCIAEKTWSFRKDRNIRMGLQTNATLLNDDIINWIKEYKFYIGLSLDGYAELHNHNRRYWSGRGSFEDVARGISLLRKAEVPFGVILVITKTNAPYLREIIDWMYDQGIRDAAFNAFMDFGRGANTTPFALSPAEDIEATKNIINHLIDINSKVPQNDRFIERNVGALLRNLLFLKSRPMCNLRSPCAGGSVFLHFEPNGDIYPCDQFVEYSDQFLLGNIWTDNVDDIWVNHPILQTLRKRTVYNITECSQCPWRLICCAGCPGSALRSNSEIFTPASTCTKHKVLIPWILEQFRERGISPELLAFPFREGRID